MTTTSFQNPWSMELLNSQIIPANLICCFYLQITSITDKTDPDVEKRIYATDEV